jgi:polysaccharide biosynthesis/export protein
MRALISTLCALMLVSACAMDVRRRPTVAVPAAPPPKPKVVAAPAPRVAEAPVRIEREVAPSPEAKPTPAPQAKPPPMRVAEAAPPPAPIEPLEGEAERNPTSDLAAIAAERRNVDPAAAYVLGPGDAITVTVFDLEEMNRKVRVSQRGDVQLPLIGSVRAAGRSESELAREIATRLERDYLQNPQVDVFVDEYRSQQVAVTGAVASPGLYPLTRDRYTILDMISEAGGLTRDAGSVIEFIPGRRSGRTEAFELARSASSFSEELAGQGIQIELNDLMRGSNRASVNVPVVAGDVIFVPESGSFAIDGWVDKPGTYPITRGMTVLGALSAGGGPLMPARLSSVELLRSTSTSGEAREIVDVDVDAIKSGEAPDVELRSGDVIRVPGNALLIPPWAVYQLFRDLIRLGASVPVA